MSKIEKKPGLFVILCSVQDTNSTNEMHRVHRKGDKRCRTSSIECPSCDETFVSPENLQEHIEKEHVQTDALSLLKKQVLLQGCTLSAMIVKISLPMRST